MRTICGPDAAQRHSASKTRVKRAYGGATLIRDRQALVSCGPGSARRHCAPKCARDTSERACMKAIIAGAGVGGLVTALMLHARGSDCEVFEQADSVRELGVGINTLSHAIKELKEL